MDVPTFDCCPLLWGAASPAKEPLQVVAPSRSAILQFVRLTTLKAHVLVSTCRRLAVGFVPGYADGLAVGTCLVPILKVLGVPFFFLLLKRIILLTTLVLWSML